MFRVEGLSKTFRGGRVVLRDVSFSLPRGETLALVGPSGAGKTTLLYLLCGLAAPTSGRVLLDGREVTKPSPEIAIILQDYGLLPWKTVLGNVALGLKIAGVGKAEREARARVQIEALGLSGRERDYPSCLSGGEQQRVAIARAFACAPKLLLMDEPFSSLDAITRGKLQTTLLDAWARESVAYVLVTHSVAEAALLGRTICVFGTGGGPATILDRFDNPGFGTPGYARTPEYFDLTRRVEDALERAFA